MNTSRKRHELKFLYALLLWFVAMSGAHADMRLSDDWKLDFNVTPAYDEAAPLGPAVQKYAKKFNAVDAKEGRGEPIKSHGFQLYLGDSKYYIQPLTFMAKDRPDESCTPEDYSNRPTYKCTQGQRYKHSCHLFFFNAKYEPVGAYRIRINESSEIFCNAIPAMGVYDKTRNELLVTYQYFPIDRKPAGKTGEVGDSWIRMTSLFRLKEEGGQIVVEQDDGCLKNPNRFETIPDARKALRACSSSKPVEK